MLFVSSHAFPGRSVPEVVAQARQVGVSNVELTAGLIRDDAMRAHIRDAVDSGMRFLTHNYFPPPPEHFVLNVASDDPVSYDRSVAMVREAMAIAHEVKAPFHSLHAGFAVGLTPAMLGQPEVQANAFAKVDFDRGKAYRRMVEAVIKLGDEAAALGLNLLLENNVLAPSFYRRVQRDPLLMTRPEEAIQLVQDVARPNVGLLVDVAHAFVSSHALGFDPHKFLTDAAPHIRALHLSGNDGQRDSNEAFDEQAWFAPRLREFADRTMVIEVYNLDDDSMRRQVDIVQRLTCN